MKLTFHLSKTQTKELIERGRRLKIAMPLPDDFPGDGDPLEFARAALTGIDRAWVRSAEILELPVIAPLVAGANGLATIWGAIAHEGCDRRKTLVYRLLAVVAEVCATDLPRHEAQHQWPAAMTIDGRQFPGATDSGAKD